jgi:predicted DNA-binding transcriptional regulator AlpA
VTSNSVSTATHILFIDDVAAMLRVSRSTIERRRREGTFPIPELPGLDSRPRWSRVSVERSGIGKTTGVLQAPFGIA